MPQTNKKGIKDSAFKKFFKDKSPLSSTLSKNLEGISIAMLELEKFFSEMVKTCIIEKCPTKINSECSYDKRSILKRMHSRLIYTIFVKIRVTHFKELDMLSTQIRCS